MATNAAMHCDLGGNHMQLYIRQRNFPAKLLRPGDGTAKCQQTRSADTQSRDRLTSLSRCVNFVRPLMFAQGSARLAKCRKDRLKPTAETIHLFRLAKMSYKEVLGRARVRECVAKR